MNNLNLIKLLFFVFLSQNLSELKSQPMGDYQDIRGPSISVSDLLGGFATLSYTYNANNLFFDHTTVSAGYMVFDGLLPEYYINYREPEHVFRPFKKGFLLSFDQSFHIPGKKRVNGTWGYKLRYIYRQAAGYSNPRYKKTCFSHMSVLNN
jgi:hypothetical protein